MLALSLSRSLSLLFSVKTETWLYDACVDTKVSIFAPVRGLSSMYHHMVHVNVLRPDGPWCVVLGYHYSFLGFLFCTSALKPGKRIL